MEAITRNLEKMTPFFDKVAKNKYIRALMNGFMSNLPLILVSSIFIMINSVPNAWGYYWPEEISAIIMVPYNFTMGLLALFLTILFTKALIDQENKELPKDKQLEYFSPCIAAAASFFILARSYDENGALSIQYLGASGIFVAIIVSIVVVKIMKTFIKNDIVIKLPKEVPQGLAKSFKYVLAFGASVVLLYAFDMVVRSFTNESIVKFVMDSLSPLFQVSDSYLGVFFIMFSVSLLTWIGIHGSTVVFSVISPIMYINLAANQEAVAQGIHAGEALTGGMVTVALLGGSGATLMVNFMFWLLAKSKANKAIGKVSIIPGNFMVNEPILYGGPILMNPYFFVPYLLAPAINAVIYKFFIDILALSGATMSLSIGTPMILSVLAVHNFQPLSFLLLGVIMLVDAIIYYPFFKAYDNKKLAEERENVANEVVDTTEANNEAIEAKPVEEAKPIEESKPAEEVVVAPATTTDNPINVLVLCIAGGTSSMLAQSINKGADKLGLNIKAKAHTVNSVLLSEEQDTDLIIMSPQSRSYYDDIKKESSQYDIKMVKTEGEQYIRLSQENEEAAKFVVEQMRG